MIYIKVFLDWLSVCLGRPGPAMGAPTMDNAAHSLAEHSCTRISAGSLDCVVFVAVDGDLSGLMREADLKGLVIKFLVTQLRQLSTVSNISQWEM